MYPVKDAQKAYYLTIPIDLPNNCTTAAGAPVDAQEAHWLRTIY